MKIRRLKKNPLQETAAASDLAFLLIIYFIVIAGFNINTGFLINLPAKESVRIILREDLIRFKMDENGSILYEGQIIEIAKAELLIRKAQNANPYVTVTITINGSARWQNVVSFVELAHDLQVESFSFSMKRETQ